MGFVVAEEDDHCRLIGVPEVGDQVLQGLVCLFGQVDVLLGLLVGQAAVGDGDLLFHIAAGQFEVAVVLDGDIEHEERSRASLFSVCLVVSADLTEIFLIGNIGPDFLRILQILLRDVLLESQQRVDAVPVVGGPDAGVEGDIAPVPLSFKSVGQGGHLAADIRVIRHSVQWIEL